MFAVVSAWMSQGEILINCSGQESYVLNGGSLHFYLSKNPKVSRDSLTIGIAQGLGYLHGMFVRVCYSNH
jgi:hypothetical protein